MGGLYQAGTGTCIFSNWQRLGNVPPIIRNEKDVKTFELVLLKKRNCFPKSNCCSKPNSRWNFDRCTGQTLCLCLSLWPHDDYGCKGSIWTEWTRSS